MTDDRVMEILKKVENKEISLDEAVRLIEDLEESDEVGDSGKVSGSSDPGNKDWPTASKISEDISQASSEVEEELGETAQEVSEAAREVSEVAREAGEVAREAGEAAREAGEAAREVGEAAREVGGEIREGLREAAREVGQELGEAAREVWQELREVAAEVREELKDAAQEVREGLKDARHEASEAFKEIGGLDAIVDGLNAVFSGLGEGLRAMFGGGRGGDFDGYPKFEFAEVREGSFATELPQLDFSHHNGNVIVDSWDKDTYRLEVTKIVKAPDEEQARKRAEQSIEVTDSRGSLGVRMRERETNGVSVTVRATLPSRLRYAGKFSFHNGSVSLEKLQMKDCVLSMHNGKLNLKDLTADNLVPTFHNGKANLENVDARVCCVTMHNGRVRGDARCSTLAVTMHNGDVNLGVSTQNELTFAATAHNGRISLHLEKAEDIGYRVEYSYVNGKASAGELAEVLEEIEFVKPKYGAGHTKWVGQSRDYESKPRKISAKCSLHNGSVSIGWGSPEKASSDW